MKVRDENAAAYKLEQHINALLLKQTSPFKIYLFDNIAIDSGIDRDLVRKLGGASFGPGNGFTAVRPGLSPDEARAECEAPPGASS